MVQLLTLAFPTKQDQLLLGLKKQGFGQGKWNGFGGKVEVGESLEIAAKRELQEESRLIAQNIEKKGILTFNYFDTGTQIEVHVFNVIEYTGIVIETEEMKPNWFSEKEIPYGSMWPDDRFWLPWFLEGRLFKGEFSFSDQNTITEIFLKQVEFLD